MTGMRLPIRAAYAAVAAVLVTGVAACSGDGDGDADLPEPGPPQPTVEEAQAPTLTAEEQQAVDEVQALFDEFLTVYVEIVTAGEPGTDSVYARMPRGFPIFYVNSEIVDNYLEDRRIEGQLEWELVEIAVVDMENTVEFRDGESVVPVVNLRYCLDATDWQAVEKDTGEPVPPGENRLLDPFGARYVVAVGAAYYDPDPLGEGANPYWQIDEWENRGDEPC